MAGHHDPVCRPNDPVKRPHDTARRPLQETTLPQQCNVFPSWPCQINRVSIVTSKTLTMMTDRNRNTFSNTSDTFTINNANENCDNDQVLERDKNSNFRGVSDETENVVVSFGKDKRQKKKGSSSNLQDVFLKFRLAKQNLIKRSQLMKERELATKCDPNQMWQLRMKFVERAKSYFGVPYAKKYTNPEKQMSKIMVQCFNAVKSKLDCRQGFFDLLGFDFLIDTDFKVWLIEINVNPALHTNCEVLRHLLPGMIEETLDIVLEIHDKNKRNRPIMPLASQRKFVTLHNGSSSGGRGG